MSWDRVPPEIFDAITEYLDLTAIKSFRLVNKCTARRCLGSRFLCFASQAETDLTSRSLQALNTRASHPIFQNVVSCLTIEATFYDRHGKYPKRTKLERFYGSRDPPYMEWLTALQTERDTTSDDFIIGSLVKALNQFSALNEIKLRPLMTIAPGVHKRLSFPLNFPWASHVVYLTLAAVARRSAAFRHLDIYNTCENHTGSGECCVPATDIAFHLNKVKGKNLNSIFLPIETLRLKVSGESWNLSENQGLMCAHFVGPMIDGPRGAQNMDNCPGVEQLLQCTSKLVKLYLAFNFDYYSGLSMPESYYTIFANIASNVCLRELKHCHLTNLPVTVDALVGFLSEHRNIVSLCILGVCIPEGERWNPILKYIGANMLNLEGLSLSCLRQGSHFVELNPDPWINRHDFRSWKQGSSCYTHHCPSDCDKWTRAHKYFRHLGRGKIVDSNFVYSRFSISWNWDYAGGVLLEDEVAGFTIGTWDSSGDEDSVD